MAVGTLALGIAASTFAQAVVAHVVRRPASALGRPEELVRLTANVSGGAGQSNVVPGAVVNVLALHGTPVPVAAATIVSGTAEAGGRTLSVNISHVADGYFAALDTRPATGRVVGALESAETDAAVVLSYGLWGSLFQFDPEVIGLRVRIDNQSFSVVGVATDGFRGVAPLPADAWVSARPLLSRLPMGADRLYDSPPFHLVARLTRPAQGAAIERTVSEAFAAVGIREAMISAAPILTSSGVLKGHAQLAAFARLLSYLAGIVLSAAVISAGGLLVAQSLERTGDLGVRTATGATRWQLCARLAVEGVVLASGAMILGIGMAEAAAGVGQYLLPNSVIPRTVLRSDSVLAALLAALVSTLGICALPAVALRSLDLHALLNRSSILGSPPRARTRSLIVALQFAFTTLLSVGAVTTLRAAKRVNDLERRDGRDRLLVADLDLAAGGGDPRFVSARLADVSDELRRTAGVQNVILMSSVPFRRSLATYVRLPSGAIPAPVSTGGPYLSAVGHEYFQALGLRVLQGRTFSSAEQHRRDPVVVINRDMAHALWGSESVPAGACLRIAQSPKCWTVIGVVENPSRESALESTTYQLFVAPDPESTLLPLTSVLIQARENAETARGDVLRVFGSQGINPAYRRVSTWRELTQNERSIWQTAAGVFLAFGFVALVITLSGTYSLVLYTVLQRRVEFGVRMALGATRWQVARPTVFRTVRDVATGVMVALALVWALDRLVTAQTLLRLPLFTAATISIAAVPLAMVAGVALWTAFVRTLRRAPGELLRGT
jgi:predicted permease